MAASAPAVSVIIPAYNAARTIAGTIASVLAQTFEDFEVIVVDDGSSDGTRQALRQFSDARLRVFSQANQRQALARNHGAAEARGELLAFLDADDWWLPEKLARQVDLIQRQPDLGLVYCDLYRFDEAQGKDIDRYSDFARLRGGRVPMRYILAHNFIQSPTPLVRKAAFTRAGGFDPQVVPCEDWDLWIRITARYPVDFIPDPLARYRLHLQATSWENQPDTMLSCSQAIFKKVEGSLLQEGLVTPADLRAGRGWMCYYYARSMMVGKEYSKARQYYLKALSYQPLHVKTYLRLGQLAATALAQRAGSRPA